MDMSLASAGTSMASSLIGAYYGNKTAKAQADAANKIRAGNNAVTAVVNTRNTAITGLQKWRQSVSNSRVYEAVAANQEALAVNFNRARDAKARSNFSTNIKQAEESGRQQAAAAASGITGSVVDVIDSTSRIRAGMERVANIRSENQTLGDFQKREFAQRWATLDSLDYSLIFDNQAIMDTGNNVAQQTNLFGAAISGKDTLKNLTQGLADFSFTTKSDPIGDFYLHGNSGSGD